MFTFDKRKHSVGCSLFAGSRRGGQDRARQGRIHWKGIAWKERKLEKGNKKGKRVKSGGREKRGEGTERACSEGKGEWESAYSDMLVAILQWTGEYLGLVYLWW